MESVAGVPAPAKKKLTFTYDYMGRRTTKKVESAYNGSAYATTNSMTFVWDGWNQIAEVGTGYTNTAMWGLDLGDSQSDGPSPSDKRFTGRGGGVGGLLAVTINGTNALPYFDGIGNVMGLVSTSGVVIAEYDYSPAGKLIRATGPMATANSWGHSTKQRDRETGFEYHDNRYVENGRFISRDPIEEEGGLNLYGFVGNDPVNRFDPFGLAWDVKREGASQADADASCDTVDALAELIGLDPAEYRKWLNPADGYPLPATSSETMKSRKFRVPNTVYTYWAGDLGSVGKGWVSWNSSVSYLDTLGFQVISYEHKLHSLPLELQEILEGAANSHALHGVYFWGHGWAPYPSSGLTDSDGNEILYYNNISLAYKMALGLVFACDSNSGKPALSASPAVGSIWHGYSGTLYPIVPSGYDVSRYIRHGDQETK